jgi:hypothetical protein
MYPCHLLLSNANNHIALSGSIAETTIAVSIVEGAALKKEKSSHPKTTGCIPLWICCLFLGRGTGGAWTMTLR